MAHTQLRRPERRSGRGEEEGGFGGNVSSVGFAVHSDFTFHPSMVSFSGSPPATWRGHRKRLWKMSAAQMMKQHIISSCTTFPPCPAFRKKAKLVELKGIWRVGQPGRLENGEGDSVTLVAILRQTSLAHPEIRLRGSGPSGESTIRSGRLVPPPCFSLFGQKSSLPRREGG